MTSTDPYPPPPPARRRPLLWLARWLGWLALRGLAVMLGLVVLFWMFNPPTTWTILTDPNPRAPRVWVGADDIAPVMLRSVVAAEDANFCRHWGFDMAEIRKVINSGSSRGASTLTQQVAKNVYLWQGRDWLRKALEALYTPMIEAVWSKRRIVEVYLNVAEFAPGVFGIHAAAAHHFATTPDKLSARQSALLAAALPNPRQRDPARPSQAMSHRARQIADGAATIAADGRDACLRP